MIPDDETLLAPFPVRKVAKTFGRGAGKLYAIALLSVACWLCGRSVRALARPGTPAEPRDPNPSETGP